MISNILIPIDFSHTSNTAISYAKKLASSFHCSVHLIHVIQDDDAHLEDLEKYKSFLQVNNTKLFTKAVDDEFPQYIIDYQQENEIDFVIMGTNGESDIKQNVVGSNADRVSKNISCPILTISKIQKDIKIDSIVYASTFEDDNLDKFPILQNLQKAFGSHIFLVHINTQDEFHPFWEIKNKMVAFSKRRLLENYSIHQYSDFTIQEGIQNFAKEVDADIISIGRQEKNIFQKIWHTSLTTEAINNSNKPILSF